MIFVNMAVLKQAPGLAKALQPKDSNPLAALLFAGITESVSASNWLAVGLRVNEKEDTLALQVVTDGAKLDAKGPAAFALPAKREEGAMPNLAVPRQIAGLSLYRDLRRFYGAKDQLFPERTSGLIFFENMMGIFFCGRDLTDDVLAQARPEIRLVVANQQYDRPSAHPRRKFPPSRSCCNSATRRSSGKSWRRHGKKPSGWRALRAARRPIRDLSSTGRCIGRRSIAWRDSPRRASRTGRSSTYGSTSVRRWRCGQLLDP